MPPELIETFVTARALADRHSPLVNGTVGTIDWQKRYSIWPGCDSRSSGSGPQTGIHMSSAVDTINTWRPKCSAPLVADARTLQT